MSIIIINTGCANISSLRYAIERLGYSVTISVDAYEIKKSKKILLPGIGTAASVMQYLENVKLTNVIKTCKQPILGICLGMQLLSSYSHETNGITMLGIIDYPVCALKSSLLPIPHNGWNTIEICSDNPLFFGIKNFSKFYFLHSYVFHVNKYTLATTHYNINFSSVINKNNFFGVQFHPEKSGYYGAKLLKNFLEI